MIHVDEQGCCRGGERKKEKYTQSELFGIQKDAVLPVSKTFPVGEEHCASGRSLNAVAADE